MNSIRVLMLISYLVNCQQIMIIIMLLNIYLPQNCYEVIRIMCAFVFKYIPDWLCYPVHPLTELYGVDLGKYLVNQTPSR